MSASLFSSILLVSLGACGAAVSVRLHQNVSLSCQLNSSSVVAWFRLSGGERVTLLVLASRAKLSSRGLIVEQNAERHRFHLEEDGLRLLILGLTDADLGLYYCATGPSAKAMHYGMAVTLTRADARRSSDGLGCGTLLACACVACGFGGLLCAAVLFHCGGSSAISCVKRDSDVEVQYSSLRWIRRSQTALPAPVDVTYSTVAKHTHN